MVDFLPMAKKKKRGQRFIPVAVIILIGLAAALWYYCPPLPTKAPALKIYFQKGSGIEAVERPERQDLSALKQAMDELLAGPRPDEAAAGYMTEIPPGTKAMTLKAEKGLAVIFFNDRLEEYGGGAAKVQALVAQIVYTATAIPGIEKVLIKISGSKEVVLGGEGLVIDRPLGRRDINL